VIVWDYTPSNRRHNASVSLRGSAGIPLILAVAALILLGSVVAWISAVDGLGSPHTGTTPTTELTQSPEPSAANKPSKLGSGSSASDSKADESSRLAAKRLEAIKNEIENLAPVDLTGLTTNADKIAKILASFEKNSGVYSEDPRLHQLKALGDSAVNDLLDAFDSVKDNRDTDAAGHMKETALRLVLEQMLQEKDKDIILSYYQEDRSFADLIWKFRFKEAGAFALGLASHQDFHGGPYNGTTAEMAVALYPEVSVPYMLANPKQKYEVFNGNFLQAIAKHAPQVDLRPTLRQVIASINPSNPDSPARTWAALALVRGMPEGFDAAVPMLRQNRIESLKQSMLEVVRNFIPFRGTAEETAAWIEKNRPNLLPEPTLPYGSRIPAEPNHKGWIDPRDLQLVSPYSPDKMPVCVRGKLPGTAVKDPFTGKMLLVP